MAFPVRATILVLVLVLILVLVLDVGIAIRDRDTRLEMRDAIWEMRNAIGGGAAREVPCSHCR